MLSSTLLSMLSITLSRGRTLPFSLDYMLLCMRISKKYFRPGGMALSEWTRSVRAVRDTLVVDYSVPSVNSTRRVPYRPLIAVSPFLLFLPVSYFKRSLWRCGQL